jgi:hypothetical protein
MMTMLFTKDEPPKFTRETLAEYAPARTLGRKKMNSTRDVLAMSSDLAQASAILANRAADIVNFASALPANCGREEAATRIAIFIESLYPASSPLQCRRPIHSGWGEIITNHLSVNRLTWILPMTTIGLLGLAIVIAMDHFLS